MNSKPAVNEFIDQVNDGLDACLNRYWNALPDCSDIQSEEDATILVKRVNKIARPFLREGVISALRGMELAIEQGSSAPSDIRELTLRALANFAKCLVTPLLSIRLKSRKRSWNTIDVLIDSVAAEFDADLALLTGCGSS